MSVEVVGYGRAYLEIAADDQKINSIPSFCLARLRNRGVDGVQSTMTLIDMVSQNPSKRTAGWHLRNLRSRLGPSVHQIPALG